MVKADLDNGFTQVANEILESLYASGLTGTEFRIMLYFVRHAYGFKRKEVRLTGGILAKALSEPERGCRRALASLVARNMLTQVCEFARTYTLQKNYSVWDSFVVNSEEVKNDRTRAKMTAYPVKNDPLPGQKRPGARSKMTAPNSERTPHDADKQGMKVVGEQTSNKDLKYNFKQTLKQSGLGEDVSKFTPEDQLWAKGQFKCFLSILQDLKQTHKLELKPDSAEANTLARLCTQKPSQTGYDLSSWGNWLREQFFQTYRLTLLEKNAGGDIKSPVSLTCHRISKEIERKY